MGKVLDLEAIREAPANLERLVAEHPELLGKSTPEEWEAILKNQNSGTERQKRLIAKRRSEGIERVTIWVSSTDIEFLRQRFPGPRNGINWTAAVHSALASSKCEAATPEPHPDPE